MIEILGLVAMILIGIFVDFVTALISLVVLCAVFTAFIFVYMGTMSLGPLGHLAVNRVRKQYDANAQKGEVVFWSIQLYAMGTDGRWQSAGAAVRGGAAGCSVLCLHRSRPFHHKGRRYLQRAGV